MLNFDNFIENVHYVMGYVFMHNALALSGGFAIASMLKLSIEDRKSITVETGIQNSGLGLLLIFNFFDGLGGMALIAAWWGIWHIIMGFIIGLYWSISTISIKIFSQMRKTIYGIISGDIWSSKLDLLFYKNIKVVGKENFTKGTHFDYTESSKCIDRCAINRDICTGTISCTNKVKAFSTKFMNWFYAV